MIETSQYCLVKTTIVTIDRLLEKQHNIDYLFVPLRFILCYACVF